MISKGNYFNGEWHKSKGKLFNSVSPVDSKIIWNGNVSTTNELNLCIDAACSATEAWENTPLDTRYKYVRKFAELVKENIDDIAKLISIEVGKPLWEAKTEASALAGKIEPTISAYEFRNKELLRTLPNGAISRTTFKPLGVIVTISPYNFPAHMANGHIIAALVCGNCVIWKPSEKCPMVAEKIMEIWDAVGLPSGVINMIQGDGNTGEYFCKDERINGIFFTGSYYVGDKIRRICNTTKMCALEMGGDSPLVVWDVSNIDAAVITTIQSAYVTSGQRCSSARRIIVKDDHSGEEYIKKLKEYIENIKIGKPFDDEQPYIGPMKDEKLVDSVLSYQNELLSIGANAIINCQKSELGECYITPGIIDVTPIMGKFKNKEVVGPLVRICKVNSFEKAIEEANNTDYGLAAGIITDRIDLYNTFYKKVKAGIINWNQQLTGASGMAPFGGIKNSGNFRPSGYFAVDYCVYAVASIENEHLNMPNKMPIGIRNTIIGE